MPALVVSNYTQLREEVRRTLLLGQQRIEQEKVRTYWETGKLIEGHLRAVTSPGSSRASRGKEVVVRLSKDLAVSETVLYRCVRFYENFPKVAARPLNWTHYRALLAIPSEKIRLKLANQAEKGQWTTDDLENKVKEWNVYRHGSADGRKSAVPLTPRKGTPYVYRLVRSEKIHAGKTDLRIDLGFSNYKEAAMKGAENFKAGDIAVSEWVRGDTYRLGKSEKTETDIFTYYAYIERVVDGDTILVQVDLGFGHWTRQYLRLRGIDCEELNTAPGRRAKAFLERELSNVPYVIITSTRSDKYDRYLADLWAGEKYLNQELLDKGFAVAVRD